jgi:hypothetical protein
VLLLLVAASAPAQTPPPPPAPEVIAPTTGEEWVIGTTRHIRWASVPGNNVSIELSRDAGATFEPVFGNVPNDGSRFWTVTGPASIDCLIRVTSLEEPTAVAQSGIFPIVEEPSPLVVVAPNGQESWRAGSLQLITWTAPPGGDVRIELSRDGGLNYETIFGSTPNDGSQPWTVPDGASAEARIRITHVNDPALTDVSDADFELAPALGITITTPSGGELWEIGTRREIRWEGTLGGGARVELSRDGGTTWEVLFSNTPNDGDVEWQVEGTSSSTCRVRVTRLEPIDDLILSGTSAADFGIVEDVTGFALTRPNGGEILIVGTQQIITWNAPSGGSVRIELSRDDGVTWEILFGSVPNDGSQVWTVAGAVSPTCRIRLTFLDDDAVDVSDGAFFVTATPGLTVESPNGGEVWTLNGVRTLFWSGLEGGAVHIELSRDGGGTWETLFARTPNDGSQAWVVAGIPTTEALLRVTRLSPPFVSDVSDALFEIDVTPLAVAVPKDGDEWVIGAQRLIQWSSLPLGEVRIDVSRDAGETFLPLFETTPNDGGQFWLVEGPASDEAVVRVTALGDVPGFGFSDGLFRIIHGTLGLDEPNGGEEWAIGSNKIITWNTTTAGSVRIELSRDGGGSWQPLFFNTPNDGNELWTVTGPPCTDCRVRVASWHDLTLQDASDGNFSILCALSTAAILPGQELTDALSAADCEAPHRPGSRGKLYTFEMPQDGLVSIDVRSSAFVGHLYLTGPAGELIAEDTELIDSIELPAGGPYTIELTSDAAAAVGAFALRLQLFDVTLITPSGGEPWKLGEYQLVTWRSGAPGVPADITIVRSGGGVIEPIALATPNDGVEQWRVTAPAAEHAVIRVCIPYGSLGTQVCDESSPIALARCIGNETRACYSGPPGTLGLGDCRRGTQSCGADGVLGACQGEVLPTTDLCGDGHDQDCKDGDVQCRPCSPDAFCSDGDACTTDVCADGVCLNSLPAPLTLFDCRTVALDQALAALLTACDGTARGDLRIRIARRTSSLLGKIDRLTAKASSAKTRKACVSRITAARKKSVKLQAHLERGMTRGAICADVATLIGPRLSGLGEAIIAVSTCDGKS